MRIIRNYAVKLTQCVSSKHIYYTLPYLCSKALQSDSILEPILGYRTQIMLSLNNEIWHDIVWRGQGSKVMVLHTIVRGIRVGL